MDSPVAMLRSRLHAVKGRWPKLARHSEVPLSTLRKIAYGDIENPGVLTVDKLSRGLDTFPETTSHQ